MLARNEHDRWNAFMRVSGYTAVTVEEAKQYYPTVKNHVDHIAGFHPAIAKFEDLDSITQEILKFKPDLNDLRESDYKLIEIIKNLKFEDEKEKDGFIMKIKKLLKK